MDCPIQKNHTHNLHTFAEFHGFAAVHTDAILRAGAHLSRRGRAAVPNDVLAWNATQSSEGVRSTNCSCNIRVGQTPPAGSGNVLPQSLIQRDCLQHEGTHRYTQKMQEKFHRIENKYYLILSVIGVPVNLLAIVILSRGKCGLSTCTTRYLVAMATADLLVIITEVILWRISYYYLMESFLYVTPVCSVNVVLRHAVIDCSVWFTVTFTFDRFVIICCQKLKTKYCTKKTAAVVLATTCILHCLKNIPFYFVYEPLMIIDNVVWLCYPIPSYFTEPGWMGFNRFDKVLTPLLPFALILLLNALTVRHILMASRVRKGLRGQSKGENHSDPEMESRRKSVILLFTISGSFILLWLVYVIHFLYYNITGTDPGDYSDFQYIFEHVGYPLRNLSCCTNTFIYGLTQSKFREQVKIAVKYPVTSIIQLMNKQNN
ncbi:probable G-protein coupled receptor 139 [Heterodontus francisci]|uniref:probable G-protein coupled receptor 139 n=1 Tax=Heterodontus francisci TaxID=7792 RepID=UPI00355B1EEE